MTDDARDKLISKLCERMESWKLNSDDARITVKLGEIRAIAAEYDRLADLEDDAYQRGIELDLLT